MDKISSVKHILRAIGMPTAQQSDLCALTVLAMANLKEVDSFASATNDWIRIHDVIAFVNANYNVSYAENSRETFRKQAMHHFRTAALIEDNGKATNSPNYRYRLTAEFLSVLKAPRDYNCNIVGETDASIKSFLYKHERLKDIYASKKEVKKMPVKINHQDFTFSPGSHNELQKAIIEEFAPRFAPNSECLYVGETTQKDLVKNVEKLAELGFEITMHNKMPDVVLYRSDKDWIYFIEAVDSVGPMSPARVRDIEIMTQHVKSGRIYITAFLDFAKYKRFSGQLAWETEVWIADMPDHMIHLNGDKFMGPR
ncbi:BsuBI/PstI family type II restriction endonuclease [Ihuprevotella massiliensis]|uniref:BsuBI/PstI family type II restriction endonuclease n=1 Tax=Ihuprevotella massiliensis TaxID=1852368 RepID=UPI00094E09E9